MMLENSNAKHHTEIKAGVRIIPGVNFLHPHTKTSKELGLDENHVIVDKTDYERVLDFLSKNLSSFMAHEMFKQP